MGEDVAQAVVGENVGEAVEGEEMGGAVVGEDMGGEIDEGVLGEEPTPVSLAQMHALQNEVGTFEKLLVKEKGCRISFSSSPR